MKQIISLLFVMSSSLACRAHIEISAENQKQLQNLQNNREILKEAAEKCTKKAKYLTYSPKELGTYWFNITRCLNFISGIRRADRVWSDKEIASRLPACLEFVEVTRALVDETYRNEQEELIKENAKLWKKSMAGSEDQEEEEYKQEHKKRKEAFYGRLTPESIALIKKCKESAATLQVGAAVFDKESRDGHEKCHEMTRKGLYNVHNRDLHAKTNRDKINYQHKAASMRRCIDLPDQIASVTNVEEFIKELNACNLLVAEAAAVIGKSASN